MTTKTITKEFPNHCYLLKWKKKRNDSIVSTVSIMNVIKKDYRNDKYVKWEDRTDPNTFYVEIMFSKSNDNGETFSMPDNISNNAETS